MKMDPPFSLSTRVALIRRECIFEIEKAGKAIAALFDCLRQVNGVGKASQCFYLLVSDLRYANRGSFLKLENRDAGISKCLQ